MATKTLKITKLNFEYSGDYWEPWSETHNRRLTEDEHSGDGRLYVGKSGDGYNYVDEVRVKSDASLSKAYITLEIKLGGDCYPANCRAYFSGTTRRTPNGVANNVPSDAASPKDASGNDIPTGYISQTTIGTTGKIYFTVYAGNIEKDTNYYIYLYKPSSFEKGSIHGSEGGSSNYVASASYTPQYTLTLNTSTGVSSFKTNNKTTEVFDEKSTATTECVASTGYYLTRYTGTNADGTSGGEWAIPDEPSTHSGSWTMNSNRTITAHATARSYTLTFDANGGVVNTGSVTVTYNTSNYYALNTIYIPTREGYTFAGYYTSTSGGTQVYNEDGLAVNSNSYWSVSGSTYKWVGTSDKTVCAHWTPISCKLTFNANGGTNCGGGNFAVTDFDASYGDGKTNSYVTVTYGTSRFSSMSGNIPTRTGYKFLGWYTAETGGTQVYDASGAAVAGSYWSNDTYKEWKYTADLTVYAHWEALATMFVKDGGSFKAGIPYVKVGGSWKRATAVYVKVGGEWKLSTR